MDFGGKGPIMKFAGKVITITFTVIMGLFTLYQLAVGNPFYDDINPFIATFVFFILGVVGVIAVFRMTRY